MLFARIPDFGSVPIGHATLSWQLPRLAKSPLVIFANQGMGLLAPMIWEDQPQATFVGIPRCFGRNGWCYEQFYHYRLGTLIRRKLADHTGPLYVAYYVTKNPSLPQLGLFGVAVNRANCQLMHTNRTPDVAICRAAHRAVGPVSDKAAPKYRLALHEQGGRPGTKVEADWHDNPCSRSSGRAVLEVRWTLPKAANTAKVFVSSPPNYTRSLFASGGRTGKAVTGNWVQAGQRFTFTDGRGKVLIAATVRYQKCKARSAPRRSGK